MKACLSILKLLLIFFISTNSGNVNANEDSISNESNYYQYFTWIKEYIQNIDLLSYIGSDSEQTDALVDLYFYLNESIENKDIDLDIFLYKLKELKLKDHELFKKIAHKAVSFNIIDDIRKKLKDLYAERTRVFDENEYLLLAILEDNIELGHECLKQENICNFILNNCFTNEQILSYGKNHFDNDVMTMKDVREILFNELHKLSRNYEIIDQILHVTAIYLKKNPDARIDFMKYDQLIASMLKGLYSHGENEKFVGIALSGYNTFKKDKSESWLHTLVHELTHQLMQILYNNRANPYNENDSKRIEDYNLALWKTIDALNKNAHYLHNGQKQKKYKFEGGYGYFTQSYYLNYAYDALHYIRSEYRPTDFDAEYIVRLPQILSSQEYCGANEDSKQDQEIVDQILQPLTGFWNTYIKPDIDAYIKANSEYDDFICPLKNF